jgi:PAS domain S-box-containing protein
MKTSLCSLFLAFIIACLALFAACNDGLRERTPPEVVKGVLDLRDWDLKRDGPVNLTGEYEFYWNQHLGPSDFLKETPPHRTGFIRVPGYWTAFQIEGRKLPGSGYATYRLRILLSGQRESLALKFLNMGTAFTAYVSGKKVASVGIAGKSRETTVPRYSPRVVDFQMDINQVEILFQVSNFHHRRGGAWEAIWFGAEEEIRKTRERKISFDLFLFGSIFIMALYHLGLFALRRKDRSPLYFGIFCFLIAIRLLSTEERYFTALFPNMSWGLLLKLEYLSFYLAVPAFTLFMQSLFQEFSRHFLRLILGVTLTLSCVVLLTSVKIFSYTLPVAEVITLIIFIYGLYVLIICSVRKRDGAFVFLMGFIILSLTILNDIMHVEKIIYTGFFAPFGLFIFIFSQAFLLSQRFSKAVATVEKQRKELEEANKACIREIMDRISVEEALRESEEKYRTILHSIEEGYYEVDLAGDLTFFNDSLCKILGYPKDQLMGMNNREYTSEKTAKTMYQTFNEVYRTGKAAKAFDWETIRKDGTTRYLEISVTLMRDSEDQPIGFRGIVRDITERKQAEEQARLHQEQLMQASKMVALGTLVSGVAHEINNPNSFIMLNAPIIRETWESASPILENYYEENGDFILGGMRYSEVRENIPKLFSGILNGSKRIKQIVEDLKHYVRKDTADLMQSVDINAVLNSAVSLLFNMIKKSTDHFTTDFEKNLPPFTGNFQRLEQVMINLIQNACQALPDASKGIFVSTKYDKETGSIVVRVGDEGVGISQECLSHIMDPFFTTKQDAGGVGLGLSISARIIEEHGGTMNFTSEPGKGTTVEIVLPLEHPQKSRKEEQND